MSVAVPTPPPLRRSPDDSSVGGGQQGEDPEASLESSIYSDCYSATSFYDCAATEYNSARHQNLTPEQVSRYMAQNRISPPPPPTDTPFPSLTETPPPAYPSVTATSTQTTQTPAETSESSSRSSADSSSATSSTKSKPTVNTRTMNTVELSEVPSSIGSATVLPIHSNNSGHPLGTGAIVAIAVAASILGTIMSILLFLWVLRKCFPNKRRIRGVSLGSGYRDTLPPTTEQVNMRRPTLSAGHNTVNAVNLDPSVLPNPFMTTSPHITTPITTQALRPRKAVHRETEVPRCSPEGCEARNVFNAAEGDVSDIRVGTQRQKVDGGVRLAGGRPTSEGAHEIELSMDGDSSISTLPPPYSQLSS